MASTLPPNITIYPPLIFTQDMYDLFTERYGITLETQGYV